MTTAGVLEPVNNMVISEVPPLLTIRPTYSHYKQKPLHLIEDNLSYLFNLHLTCLSSICIYINWGLHHHCIMDIHFHVAPLLDIVNNHFLYISFTQKLYDVSLSP